MKLLAVVYLAGVFIWWDEGATPFDTLFWFLHALKLKKRTIK